MASRMRSEHIPINKYLHTIGKRDDPACQCGKGEQSVKHLILECAFTEDGRAEAREAHIDTVETMVGSKEGGSWLYKIWKEFVKKKGGEEDTQFARDDSHG